MSRHITKLINDKINSLTRTLQIYHDPYDLLYKDYMFRTIYEIITSISSSVISIINEYYCNPKLIPIKKCEKIRFNHPSFGNRVTIPISRYPYLVSKQYLRIVLPEITFKNNNDVIL